MPALAVVTDIAGKLVGLITDGDLRRALLADEDALRKPCSEHLNRTPRTIGPEYLAAEILQVMQSAQIGEMPVLDSAGHILGMLNLKDLLHAGIV